MNIGEQENNTRHAMTTTTTKGTKKNMKFIQRYESLARANEGNDSLLTRHDVHQPPIWSVSFCVCVAV